MKEFKTKIEITEDDIREFEEEAENVKGSLAVEVSTVIDGRGREVQTEIIDLTLDGDEEAATAEEPVQAKNVTSDAKKPVKEAKKASEDTEDEAEDGEEELFL